MVLLKEEQASKNTKANEYLDKMPLPTCVIDADGNIQQSNEKMKDVFAYADLAGSSFFALTGVKRSDLEESQEVIIVERNERYFEIRTLGDAKQEQDLAVFFADVTSREELKKSYEAEKLCTMYIGIDNYDELMTSVAEDSRMSVSAEVDAMIRDWIKPFNATMEQIDADEYVFELYRRDANQIIENRFSILDGVREIETKVDFPVSLSIGLGMEGETLQETAELAAAGFELAKGRGGDQAVLRKGDRTYYYGGKLQSMEKNNKGKSRVIAHAMKQLINDADRVLIMGHRWPDMDSFGSAIGMHRICTYLGKKEVYIVLEEYNEAIATIFSQAKETGNYEIITRDKAQEICHGKTLLIIVDTHKPSLMECPELLGAADKIIVVDHHRLTEDAIEDATLAYVESYASSAAELTTEIMQYIANKRIVNKFEAESLLAGITVDTNSFSSKTGVRTFEAAAWLRRAGADTTEVKRFFQSDEKSIRMRAEAVASAQYLDGGYAIALSQRSSQEAQIVCAKIADELLMVKDVRASFAIGRNEDNVTVISARSLGEVNVQLIMERFGGGGHLTSAGAQVEDAPQVVAEQLSDILTELLKAETETEEE